MKLALGAAMVAVATSIIIDVLRAPAVRAQDATDWQTRAGGRMAFDVASVKLSKPDTLFPPTFLSSPAMRSQICKCNRPAGASLGLH